jgi:hypothetical protein
VVPLAGIDPLEYLSKLGVPGIAILAVVLLVLLAQVLPGLRALVTAARVVGGWLPIINRRSSRDEILARQRLARLLLQDLDLLEDELHWQRDSFADVRVTIEARDTPKRLRSRLLLGSSPITYRTRSLSKALEREHERVVLLQGTPGSGKSVAMRHFARVVLERAAKARFARHPLALCVSLRDFEATPSNVTATNLRSYIESQVNSEEAAELSEYLKDGLAKDLVSGDVIVLLDSFDEIPAVFGTQEIDAAVRPYVRAISSLMGGGSARCVVSSRDYKGPRVEGWTRLELLGLSFDEQVRMLSRYGLSDEQLKLVEPLLRDPRAGFSPDMRNPLQLALLASFVKAHNRRPLRPSELFDDYVTSAINEAALGNEASVRALQSGLQAFAFGLMKRPDAGLSTAPSELKACLREVTANDRGATDLLEIAKKSKLLIETAARPGEEKRLAFVHRRVQEYFATVYVSRHPTALSTQELAGNPRWRETAVTLLQVARADDQPELLAELRRILEEQRDRLRREDAEEFRWHPAAIHCLELLVAAYAASPGGVPEEIAAVVSGLSEAAWKSGTISDRKFALDCLPTAPGPLQSALIDGAFRGNSDWLRMAALRDCGTLHPLPEPVDQSIRRLLITLMGGGRMSREAKAIDSDLRRLYRGDTFVRLRQLLVVTPALVVAACVAHIVYDFASDSRAPSIESVRLELIFWLVVPIAIFWIFQSTKPLSYGQHSSARRILGSVMKRGLGWQVDDFSSKPFALLLVGVIVVDSVASLAVNGITIANGNAGFIVVLGLILGPVLAMYALSWGPTILAGVHQSWFTDDVRFYEPFLIFRRGIPEAYERCKGFVGFLVRAFIVGIAIQAVGAGVILGLLYLLDHLAGDGGRIAVKVISVLFLAFFPAIIILAIGREVRSRRRIRRMVGSSGNVTPKSVLSALVQFKDISEASVYLELMRLRRAEDMRRLPRVFVRQLIRLVESARHDEQLVIPADLEESLRMAMDEGRLDQAVLLGWRGSVLDQLGQLDEFLRER